MAAGVPTGQALPPRLAGSRSPVYSRGVNLSERTKDRFAWGLFGVAALFIVLLALFALLMASLG